MDLEQAQLQIAYLTRDNVFFLYLYFLLILNLQETLKKEISDTHNQFKTHSFSPYVYKKMHQRVLIPF